MDNMKCQLQIIWTSIKNNNFKTSIKEVEALYNYTDKLINEAVQVMAMCQKVARGYLND